MTQKNPKIATLKDRYYGNRLVIRVAHLDPPEAAERTGGILMDSSGWMRCSIHPSKAPQLNILKDHILTDFRVSDHTIYINENTLIYRTGRQEIPDDIAQKAKAAAGTPVHPYQKIEDILSNQTRRKVSTIGTIISNNAKAKAGSVDKKELTISDESGRIQVTLWRGAANRETMVGQKLKVKDCFVDKNKFIEALNINVNSSSNLEIFQEDEAATINIIGIKGEINQSTTVLAEVHGQDRELTIESTFLKKSLGQETASIDDLLEFLPFFIEAKIVANEIKQLS